MINIIVLNSIHSRSGPNRHGVLSGGESHLWRDALSHHCLTNRSALIRGDLLESCKMSNSANSTITAKNELIMIKTCERASLEVNHGRLEVESHFMTVKLYKLSLEYRFYDGDFFFDRARSSPKSSPCLSCLTSPEKLEKQVRIHDKTSRVLLGRGSNAQKLQSTRKTKKSKGGTDRSTDRPTDRPTDRQSDLQSGVHATKNEDCLYFLLVF